MSLKLVLNRWFIVDTLTTLLKYALMKYYAINGNDEKIKTLQILAETNYITTKRIDFAEKCVILNLKISQ